MAGRIHLCLPNSLDAEAKTLVECAAQITKRMDADLTASIVRTDPSVQAHWMATEYMYADLAELRSRAENETRDLKTATELAANRAGIHLSVREIGGGVSPFRQAVLISRSHDFTIVGLGDGDSFTRGLVEELIFDSGRPVLVWPKSRPAISGFRKAVVAWDHSEPVARTLIGALPLLRTVAEIEVLTVRGGKRVPVSSAAEDAAHYLRSHGLSCGSETLESEGRQTGRFIVDTAIERGGELIVMGAYSTLRAKEYLLGGVTLYVLNEPRLPVLMAN